MGYSCKMVKYPGIEPRRAIGKPTERKILTMGTRLNDGVMSTHNNSLANLVRGVGERVLYTDARFTPCILPARGVFENKLGGYRTAIASRVGWQAPVTRQEFAQLYKGPRQATYLRAVESLSMRRVERSDSRLKTFVKAEKLNLTIKQDPVPRVIQPRDPRYNVEVGRYLKPVEHKIYDAIDGLFGGPTVFSKYNAFQQARHIYEKWTSYPNPVCVGLDASRFDQHVSEQALKFEHGLYRAIFKSVELDNLLRWQLDNFGVARAADGEFSYKKRGGRASGDMNTSLGNKFLMCLMCKSYMDSKNFRIDLVNNGDDCLLILDQKNLESLSDIDEWFKLFGFKLTKEKPVSVFEHIEFCQTKPVKVNGTWRMVRNVSTCLLKDTTVINLGHREDEYRKRLRFIGDCGAATCADVPVLGRFYQMLKRIGCDGKTSHQLSEYDYYVRSSRDAHCHHDSPDASGRYSFWLQTGILPDAQIELENYFDRGVWGRDKRQLIGQFQDLVRHLLTSNHD